MASEPEQPPDLQALTVEMSRGDEAAFREFYRLYFNRLLRYLLVVSNGQEDIAREALQLAFVRVALHARRFDSESAFWKWLTVLARSSFVDEMRKRSRYQSLLARFFWQRRPEADPQNDEGEERFVQLLKDEIAGLPVEERVLLERKYFGGEAVKQLADELQTTEKAMESRLLRIRRKLKAAMLKRLQHETTR